MISRVAILGTGLIGSSFALALKQRATDLRIVGCDRPEVLTRARAAGIIDDAESNPVEAIAGCQLILLAAPVQANLELLRTIAPHLPPDALVTDAGSTKAGITALATELFGGDALRRFLPGHPIAGKEVSGVEHADGNLFVDASWVLTPEQGLHALIAPEFSRGLHAEFMRLLETIRARIVVTTPAEHDRVLAYTSHLPQLVATALAATLLDAMQNQPGLRELSGRALREMTRLAASDPRMWSDIASQNRANLASALREMEQALARLRLSLGTEEFTHEFERARRFDPDATLALKESTDPPKFW